MSHIHFIITGGTIDSEYDPPKETANPCVESVIPSYITVKIKPHSNIDFKTLCLLDSSDITDEIRSKIVKEIIAVSAKKIIITHGTNTMTETAEFLDRDLGQTPKTIILTGAMIPLKEFAMSDAGFNLGYALAQVQNLPPGVFICMHGETFKPGAVTKNVEQARFYAK